MAPSEDLRKRVVEAVVMRGLSRNAAARRFRVSIASVERCALYDTEGADFAFAGRSPVRPYRDAARLFAPPDPPAPDLTLLETRERLIQNCGERFSVAVLRRFLDRYGATFKKPRTLKSRGAPTFLEQRQSWPHNSILIPRNSSSSASIASQITPASS
jgi:transposase